MKIRRVTLGSATIAACALIALLFIGFKLFKDTEGTQPQLLRTQPIVTTRNIDANELERHKTRALEAEADLALLLQAVERHREARPSPAMTSLSEFNKALDRGLHMVNAGNYEEALDLYRKLYFAGHVGPTTASRGMLLRRFSRLADLFPPAASAMRDLRDAALRRLTEGDYDRWNAADFVMLNLHLGDHGSTAALYHTLPVDHPIRRTVAFMGSDSFIATQEYLALFETRPLSTMISEFERNVTRYANQPQSFLDHIVSRAALDIEVLIGVGRNDEAKAMIDRVLQYDSSEGTRNVIQKHTARAQVYKKG